MSASVSPRSRWNLLALVLVWAALYASFALWHPALLDDADSVHAEVAREMLQRHDFVTLYANGIRYLEKAPLMYWSMALSMKLASWLGAQTPEAMAAAARFPLALAVLGLALVVERLAWWLYGNARAGVYAGLMTLSSAGIFLFSRITLPDVFVCLWLGLAMLAVLGLEATQAMVPRPVARERGYAAVFGLACALGVLSKGLIGMVFPLAISGLYLLVTRGWRCGLRRLAELPWWTALLVFFAVAAPWHVLAGAANPAVGHPEPFRFVQGHWRVPLPTDGNVRGWWWFYFMNEHVLRYLNLRVPRDYDTSPLWLFWGLCFVWIMPWSAFVFKASAAALRSVRRGEQTLRERGELLVLLWATVVLGFFTLSTRQEYYVLPALPALSLLIAGWLAQERDGSAQQRAAQRCTLVLVVLGALFAAAAAFFLLVAKAPPAGTDLASLLRQNPGDYALSMGHFLDLDTRAMGMFRWPLFLAALSLLGGPLVSYRLRARGRSHGANLALATGACGFLVAAHLGLQTFAPVLSSAQLAEQIAPLVAPGDLVVIHGEYESGSTLGFYLRRANLHILEGRSSNLWYGSFFPDSPKIFETPSTIASKWNGPTRIFLWQSITDPPNVLPVLPGPVFVIAQSGGKEIVSNRR
ncbi:MAG: phospholipid carrier-dependent glycosyltransferase [Acidobacteriaceae bacterium]|nr:phospholipid carrier-dependent glycosyltransferase [Acidobacteriaceae bacterium]